MCALSHGYVLWWPAHGCAACRDVVFLCCILLFTCQFLCCVVLCCAVLGLLHAGEYISVASQKDAEEADIEKERAEQRKGPAARQRELEELAQIYVNVSAMACCVHSSIAGCAWSGLYLAAVPNCTVLQPYVGTVSTSDILLQ